MMPSVAAIEACGWKNLQSVAHTSSTSRRISAVVARDLGVRLGAEDVGVDVGEVRHVEKILDDPEA